MININMNLKLYYLYTDFFVAFKVTNVKDENLKELNWKNLIVGLLKSMFVHISLFIS